MCLHAVLSGHATFLLLSGCRQTCALAERLHALLPEVLKDITATCLSMSALSIYLLLPAAVLKHCSSPAL